MDRVQPIRRIARLAAGLALSLPLAAAADPALVVLGARLFDGTGAPVQPDTSVLVIDGRIAAVAPAADLVAPEDAVVVEAGGATLLPGLVEAHGHLSVGPVELGTLDGAPALVMKADEAIARHSLLALLAHGVTTVRDPAGDTDHAVAVRRAVTAGEWLGPTPVVAGSVLDRLPFPGLSETVSDETELRAAVRRQAAAGVDFVKLYTSLSPELVAAGIETARQEGVGITGHLEATTWTQAARLGIDSVEHLLPGSVELLPADTRDSYRQHLGTFAFAAWYERADYDGPEIREMIATLAEEETFVVPTLVMLEAVFNADRPGFGAETPGIELLHPALLENFRSFLTFNFGWLPAHYEAGRAVWPRVLDLTRRLWENGVPLAVGTDANNPWLPPGASLHREMEILVEAGIPAAEVLRMATAGGAALAGRLPQAGTIAVGKRADLVLVAGDPLADISALRRIEWVMKDGRIHDPKELLAALDE